jgi:hypothetical protein
MKLREVRNERHVLGEWRGDSRYPEREREPES